MKQAKSGASNHPKGEKLKRNFGRLRQTQMQVCQTAAELLQATLPVLKGDVREVRYGMSSGAGVERENLSLSRRLGVSASRRVLNRMHLES